MAAMIQNFKVNFFFQFFGNIKFILEPVDLIFGTRTNFDWLQNFKVKLLLFNAARLHFSLQDFKVKFSKKVVDQQQEMCWLI